MDGRMESMDGRMESMEGRMTSMQADISDIRTVLFEFIDFVKDNVVLKEDLERTHHMIHGLRLELRADMRKVQQETIDIIDRKLVNLRGDIIGIIRGDQAQFKKLLEILAAREVITVNDVQAVVAAGAI